MFVVSSVPTSFDSRHFGPIATSSVHSGEAAVDGLTIALACSLYPDAVLVEKLVRDASRATSTSSATP